MIERLLRGSKIKIMNKEQMNQRLNKDDHRKIEKVAKGIKTGTAYVIGIGGIVITAAQKVDWEKVSKVTTKALSTIAKR